MISKALALLVVVTTFIISPIAPLVARAQTNVGLTGEVGAHVQLRTNSGEATSNESSGENVDAQLGTIVITRADMDAEMKNTAAASETSYTENQKNDNLIASSNELKAHAKMVARSDAKIDSLSLGGDKVSMTYREPATLFGVIRMHVPVTVTVDADGVTHVSYPWYSFLLSTDKAGLSIRTQAAVNAAFVGASNASLNGKTSLSLSTQARLIDSVHSALKATADASTSIEAK